MGISWEHAGKLIRMSWGYHGNTMERNIGNSMAILWDTYGNVIWIKGATSYTLWRMLRTCCGCKARFQKACCCGTHLRQIVSLRKSAQDLSWMSDCIWKGHVLVEVWPVHFWMRRPLLRPHTVDSSNFSVRTNLIFQLRLGTGTRYTYRRGLNCCTLQGHRVSILLQLSGPCQGVAEMALQQKHLSRMAQERNRSISGI